MDRGDIMSYLNQNPYHDRFAAVCQIVDGVEYLHTLDPPVTHDDIKGANVLVTDEGICCLADFGSAIFGSQGVDESPGLQGSIHWLAPELMQPVRPLVHSAKACDIYALACTIYEIYIGEPPLSDLPNNAAVMLKVLTQKQRALLPPKGTWTYEEQQLWVLVRQSWAQNPEDRFEIRKIKNFLKDLACDKTPEGRQGGSPSPSPETDSASEAARDLDRVRIWLDRELYGHSTSLAEGFQNWDSSGSYSQQRNSLLFSSRLTFKAYTRPSRVKISEHPMHAQAQLPRHSLGPSQMTQSRPLSGQSLRVPPPRQSRPYSVQSLRVPTPRRSRPPSISGYTTDVEKESPRRCATRPPVDEVPSRKDWVGVPGGRRGYESKFRPPLLPPVAGAPLPHSTGPLHLRGDTYSESIQERLRQLDEMDLSESRILLLEKIHQEMWAELPTIRFIKWDDLPWPVFVRTTCPEDLTLHRIVSYLLQVSSGMDIKAALVDSSRLQWAQQRLQILLRHWEQPSFQKKVEKAADKTMIQGINVVTNHLESVLEFVNMHQIDEAHHTTDLSAIISQTFLEHVGQNLARIITDRSDNSGYRSLLKLKGDSAQKMLNFLQMLLDCSELVSLPRNDILGALLRLSRSSELYPECLTITDLERDDYALDSGRFGEIYKGRSRNQAICLKIIKVNRKTEIKRILKAFFKEALLWGHLSHPNILPFYGIHHLDDTHGRLSFVSPWMENGNVTEYLKRHPLANRLLLIWDIILGIKFLHQNQVIHGDLKGLNVLVNRSRRGCLADFGLANLVDDNILHWTSIQTTGPQSGGTLRWQAPELINPPSDESAKATPASDIYSFACVCYEVSGVGISKTVL
ncbi:hypothetical protein K443DRAFT_236688 [Laccaria amethystina LaAM-08-1]|uniref:Protein kinase domain-containing protein n=1 Tax=Laccaria amethystina LaAM-08-1 TaxID=1095629 RepID=A0A0C9WY36_9AGAR|nr:hypothetical protein K443DRAFT_236688 [Laccaria amethystina LaAM-08-1]